jgi:hypothetical protein
MRRGMANARQTMTVAISEHGLSKLDLFTPNKLHPTLPPLTLGTYMCMGNETLMLSNASVLERKAHLHGLLGDKANDAAYIRRRVAAHDRLILHMDIMHRVSRGKARWIKAYRWAGVSVDEEAKKRRAKSLRSSEDREAYVRKGLKKQWQEMGMGAFGSSEEEAVEIE